MKACTLLFHQTFGEKFSGERLGCLVRERWFYKGGPKKKVDGGGIKPSQECIYFSSGMVSLKIGMPIRTHISMH